MHIFLTGQFWIKNIRKGFQPQRPVLPTFLCTAKISGEELAAVERLANFLTRQNCAEISTKVVANFRVCPCSSKCTRIFSHCVVAEDCKYVHQTYQEYEKEKGKPHPDAAFVQSQIEHDMTMVEGSPSRSETNVLDDADMTTPED
eukprot:TRINITY_DN682_c0_g2_i31.p2 TRINITY_DN682_c0_g2~~TRINITY_DN682_c0_g2_i31.p2  ORF type:complete len:145 (+),score=23.27 TRINITY_DN682_c0_g2_i31:581-1015(+)